LLHEAYGAFLAVAFNLFIICKFDECRSSLALESYLPLLFQFFDEAINLNAAISGKTANLCEGRCRPDKKKLSSSKIGGNGGDGGPAD